MVAVDSSSSDSMFENCNVSKLWEDKFVEFITDPNKIWNFEISKQLSTGNDIPSLEMEGKDNTIELSAWSCTDNETGIGNVSEVRDKQSTSGGT